MVDLVTLDRDQVMKALEIAHLRNAPKEAGGVAPSSYGQRALSAHLTGSLAEIAAAVRYGVEIDENFYMAGDGHRADIKVNGWDVEVKGASHKPPILKFNQLIEFKSDVALLCYVDRDQIKKNGGERADVELHGVVSRVKFNNNHYVKSFGYGDRYCMAAASLADPKALEDRSKQ